MRISFFPIKYGLLGFMMCLTSITLWANTVTNSEVSLGHKTKATLPITHWQTAQGIPVYFVSTPGLPMLDLEVIFQAGSSRDGEKFGLAQLTNALLNEGAGDLTVDQIGEQFDEVGAIYHSEVNRDMGTVALRTLTHPEFLNPALRTFATVLTAPTFTMEAFNRLQKQLLTAIAQEMQAPSIVASKAFIQLLYPQHPYGHSVNGTVETVSELTAANIKQFYEQYYVAKNAQIIMVGDLTIDQAKHIADQVTQGLSIGSKPLAIPMAVDLTRSSEKNIVFPSQQTTIILGEMGITPKDLDYFPLMVGNYVLGGDATSRLFMQVREEQGLTYQVNSQFIPLLARGPFIIFLQSRKDEASKAMALSREILQNYIKNGPSTEELSTAQKHLVGGFPLSIASNTNILEQLAAIVFYGLPLDYLDTYRQNVTAVTAEQIQAAFARHINPDRIVAIAVGQ